MKKHDWIKNSGDNGEKKKDEFAAEEQSWEENGALTRPMNIAEENKNQQSERSTIGEVIAEKFDPLEYLAVLVLVDIAPKVKERLPDKTQCFRLKSPVTIFGNNKRAKIKLDDLDTIKPEHAAIAFKDGAFHVAPQEGSVLVDGRKVSENGEPLKHGMQLEIGSAMLVFLFTQRNYTSPKTDQDPSEKWWETG